MTIKPERTKTDRAQRREQTAGGGDLDTRERVIKAAVECIIDLGFYRGPVPMKSLEGRGLPGE